MAAVPTRFAQVILCFSGLFCQRTWRHAQLLFMGAVLVPGVRTVTGVLRVLGLAHERHFEVTFAETRRHLGVETQRQWSSLAIARTTPVLLGRLSLVTLLANRLVRSGKLPMRQAAWYVKDVPTFSDALATVRAHWWRAIGLSTSSCKRNIVKVPRSVWRRLHEAACYAA